MLNAPFSIRSDRQTIASEVHLQAIVKVSHRDRLNGQNTSSSTILQRHQRSLLFLFLYVISVRRNIFSLSLLFLIP